MDNSINFKSAIVLEQPTTRIQRLIKPALGSHFQKFKDFTPEGDILYIVRRGKDNAVADFLTHHRTPFKFYTDLSTKSGFHDQNYAEARQILNNYKSKIITTIDELKEHFGLNKCNVVLPFSTKRKANPIELSVQALGFDSKNVKIDPMNGYYDVKDNDGKLLARISGPGKYGISFAFKFSKNTDNITGKKAAKTATLYAIRGGKLIFEYTNPFGKLQFKKNYTAAVNANKVIKKTDTNESLLVPQRINGAEKRSFVCRVVPETYTN